MLKWFKAKAHLKKQIKLLQGLYEEEQQGRRDAVQRGNKLALKLEIATKMLSVMRQPKENSRTKRLRIVVDGTRYQVSDAKGDARKMWLQMIDKVLEDK